MVLVAINFRSTHLRHETLPVCAPLRRPGWNVTLSGLFWGRALSARHPGRLDALVSTRWPWGPPGGPAGRPRRLACHALFFLLVPSTLAHAIGPGVCAHSDGSEPGRHCRARAVGTPRARPLSPPAPSFLGRVVGLQIGVMTHPGGVHVGSGPLRFGRVICNFRTPIERVELSKFPFDIFLYNCFDISIYKFLFWLKLDWKSAFLDKPCLARGLGLVLSRFNWGASRPVATDRRGQPDPLRVPEGSPLGVWHPSFFCWFPGSTWS